MLEEKGPILMAFNQSGRRQDWYPAAELLTCIEKVLHEQRMLPAHVNHEVEWLRASLFEMGVTESKTRQQQRVLRGAGPSKNEECFHIPQERLQAALRKLSVPQDGGEETLPTALLESLHVPAGGSGAQTAPSPTGTDDIPF